MGGTSLKSEIIIENEVYYIKGDVSAWETCLWRLRVHGEIIRKKDDKRIKFDYENIDRDVRNRDSYPSGFCEDIKRIIATIGDLIIIRAIDSSYYSEYDPLKDSDLNIDRLFKEDD